MPRSPHPLHPRALALAVRQTGCALLSLLILTFTALPALAGDWQWRHPLPQGNALTDIAHGNGRYVAVGDAGTLVVSSDGQDWQLAPFPSSVHLRAVSYGNGTFVAVGDAGTVLYSDDGMAWSAADSGVSVPLYFVVHGDDGFVSVGGTTMIVSDDGQTWSAVTIDIPPNPALPFPHSLQHSAYGNGRYVVMVGLQPFDTVAGRLLISDNARDWQVIDLHPPEGGAFGLVLHRGLVFGQDRFVAAVAGASGAAATLRSNDGIEWDWYPAPTYNGLVQYMRTMTYDAGNDLFVGLANPNDPPPSVDLFPVLVSSVDGGAFSVDAALVAPPLRKMQHADQRLLAVGPYGGIFASSEGSDWQPLTHRAQAWSLVDVLGHDSDVYAFGDGPTGHSDPFAQRGGVIMRSVDGAAWQSVPIPVASGHRSVRMASAAANGGVLLALGMEDTGYAVYRHTAETGWTRISLAPELGPNDVAQQVLAGNAGEFLVTGTRAGAPAPVPYVLRSTDGGLNWELHPIAGADDGLGRVLFDGTRFFALPPFGSDGLYTSADGVAWSMLPLPAPAFAILEGIAHRDGILIVLASQMSSAGTTTSLLRSVDGGANWQTSAPAMAAIRIHAVASGFLAGDAGGGVYRSQDGLAWSSASSGARAVVTGAHEAADGRTWIVTSDGGILEQAGDTVFRDGFEP